MNLINSIKNRIKKNILIEEKKITLNLKFIFKIKSLKNKWFTLDYY